MNSNKHDNERNTGAGSPRRNTVEGVASRSGLAPFSFDPSLRELFDGACDDTLTDEQFDRLDALLAESEVARKEYLRYFTINGEMRYLISMGQADQAARERTGAWNSAEACFGESTPAELFGSPAGDTAPGGFFQGVFGSLTHDWARAYLLAAAVLGLFLLAASIIHVSRHATNNQPMESAGNVPGDMKLEFVARVTGMKDCDWADPKTEPFAGAMIRPGRKFVLSAGLLEITYTDGAKVILEGPCDYTVDSRAGGFLRIGRLVARVEKKVASGEWRVARKEGRGERGEGRDGLAASAASDKLLATGHRPLATNPQPPVPSPQPLFAVRTPSAIVTDLGTEFGVEVDASGNTTSHVFQGLVKLEAIGGGSPESVMLRKDETASARIGPSGTSLFSTVSPKFVREIVRPLREIDLLDIIAGGNGSGNEREKGIDQHTGQPADTTNVYDRKSDNRYHPVEWNRLIDGVFVPNGDAGAVQLDSAGHAFNGFPTTSGITWSTIWPRAYEVDPKIRQQGDEAGYWLHLAERGEEAIFMPNQRGLLGLHANAGITFDLAELRRVHNGLTPARFSATAGMLDARLKAHWANSTADVWIFVDGQLKLKREKLHLDDGAFTVSVELSPTDRFLTLVSTDGGDRYRRDWVVFGDPVLKLTSTKQDQSKGEPNEPY